MTLLQQISQAETGGTGAKLTLCNAQGIGCFSVWQQDTLHSIFFLIVLSIFLVNVSLGSIHFEIDNNVKNNKYRNSFSV